MKKLKAIIIGCGSRGTGYAITMKENLEKFEVVAIAEPMRQKRNNVKDMFGIPEEMCFESWEPLLELGKIADFAVVATMDRMHTEPVLKAISLGYDLLLEKPIAPTPEECAIVAKAAKEKGVKTVVCHVLRYAPLFVAIKSIIESGKLGDVVSVVHQECVGNIHQSHSFVRGNWGNSDKSSFMLLQKSCHDLDILQWLIDKKCKKIQSFGSLSYFTEKNAPAGAPERCIEGCPAGESCPYNAVKVYLESKDDYWFRPASTHEIERDNYIPTNDDVKRAIETTQYGKCVFKCDNNVVDHQVVNMLFEDGVTVSFTMCAFNKGGRYIHIMGTKGELRAAMDDNASISIYDFEKDEIETVPMTGKDGVLGGHGGGDAYMLEVLYEYFAEGKENADITEAMVSYQNHLLAFAAEKSRIEGTVVDMDEYAESFK